MAEPTSKLHMRPNPNKFIPSLLQKALIFIFFAFVLPQIPSQAPEFITSQTILNKGFELIYLLLIGITVSYGLFSRKNTDPLPVKEIESKPNNPNLYASQILPSLDQDEGEGEEDGEAQQIWRKQYYPNPPLLVISKRKGETIDKPLFLPVRSLNPQKEGSSKDENTSVLPSPIPWRSRSGRMEAKDELNPSKIRYLHPSSSSSPKKLSPSPSLSRENSSKKKNLLKEITSLPPIPPPPPPPFHSDRKIKSTVKKCFKDELIDVSMRNRAHDFVANSSNLQRQKKNSIDGSSSSFCSIAKDPLKDESIRSEGDLVAPKPRQRKNSMGGPSSSLSIANDEFKDESMRFKEGLISSKPIRPRNSFDGSNSSSFAKSVRTLRPKEVQNEHVNKVIETFFVSSENDESDSSGSEEGETEYDEYSDKEVTVKEDNKKVKENDEANEVDKKADEFIAKFREQIRLQRIESIKRSAGQKAVRSHNKKLNS